MIRYIDTRLPHKSTAVPLIQMITINNKSTYINVQTVGGVVQHGVPVLVCKFPISFSGKLKYAGVYRKVARNNVLEIVSQHTQLVLPFGVGFHPNKYTLCVCGAGHGEAEKDALVHCAKNTTNHWFRVIT